MAHVHQLHGGLLHNSPIGQNALPDSPIVLQDKVPSGHSTSPPLLGTAVDGTEPGEDGFHQAGSNLAIGLHTLHPWSELLPLLSRPEPACVQPGLESGRQRQPAACRIVAGSAIKRQCRSPEKETKTKCGHV